MNDRRLEQAGAATGIVFVVLLVISVFGLPTPPELNESPLNVSRYFQEHQDAIRSTTFIGMIAGFFFLWFLGSLRSFLRVAEGGTGRLSAVAFAGGIAAAAMAGVGSTAMTVGALRPGTSPFILQTLYDLNVYLLAVGSFSLAAYLAAGSVVMIRTGALPSWLGWGGALLAVVQLLTAIAIFGSTNGAFNPHDGFVAFVGFIGFLLWTLATSVFLVRRPGPAPGS
jgi:hypothetical protein